MKTGSQSCHLSIALLSLLLITVTVFGCMSAVQELMIQNNAKMRTLQAGMSEDQVIEIMGPSPDPNTPNPYRSEMYQAEGATVKVLFFYTNLQAGDNIVDDEELTPVVFKNGHLDGWGWSYWQTTAERYDIRIRVRK